MTHLMRAKWHSLRTLNPGQTPRLGDANAGTEGEMTRRESRSTAEPGRDLTFTRHEMERPQTKPSWPALKDRPPSPPIFRTQVPSTSTRTGQDRIKVGGGRRACPEDALARALSRPPPCTSLTNQSGRRPDWDPEDLLSAGRSWRQAASKPIRLPASVTPGCFIIVTCMWRRRREGEGSAWTWPPAPVVTAGPSPGRSFSSFARVEDVRYHGLRFEPSFTPGDADRRVLVWATRASLPFSRRRLPR